MKVIAVFSQKGGSGKSTTAIHLAVEASTAHKTALIDADGQGTGTAWAGGRTSEEPAVVPGAPSTIVDLLASAESEGFELVFVDCPPHIVAGAVELASVADLVVVPVQPTFPDLAALNAALSVVVAAGKPFVFVLTRADNSAETREAIDKLAEVAPVCPTIISDRKAYQRALTTGSAVSETTTKRDAPARAETKAVYQWLMEKIK
ncbi:ParA family protein [Paraburkholderia bryophila]|nr:ParA family protein [Paraburkholderia bryophila]